MNTKMMNKVELSDEMLAQVNGGGLTDVLVDVCDGIGSAEDFKKSGWGRLLYKLINKIF
ncbi:MAG: bacteriocin [Lachnospiraceae bacterium]|nr:bacteriocin [Lachnospiraceae bacterium]